MNSIQTIIRERKSVRTFNGTPLRQEDIIFFNEQRPAYSLNYLTPHQYRERFASV